MSNPRSGSIDDSVFAPRGCLVRLSGGVPPCQSQATRQDTEPRVEKTHDGGETFNAKADRREDDAYGGRFPSLLPRRGPSNAHKRSKDKETDERDEEENE